MAEGRRQRKGVLGTAYERHARGIARLMAGGVLIGGLLVSLAVSRSGLWLWAALPVCLIVAWAVHAFCLRKVRRRRVILSRPFPPEWEAVLVRDVAFYRVLEPDEKERFRAELAVFLAEKRITGIKTDIDTRTRVLVGASAVIPIFGFPAWEWDDIHEVLVYPGRFDPSFDSESDDRNTLGMVGTGVLSGTMILVEPDLVHGFENAGDKRNVGIHEFAHLVDKADGDIDGVPAVGLTRRAVGPWIELVRRKMLEIAAGRSDIDRYALTDEGEFFSVAAEYFFERPAVMESKHPELYAALQKAFMQDMGSRAGAIRRDLTTRRKKLGRNSPCPCGSGLKFKKCCLRR